MINLKFEKNSIQAKSPPSARKSLSSVDGRNAIQMLNFLMTPKGRQVTRAMSDEFQTVTEIQNQTRMNQSEVSTALQQMRRFDLVLVERVGKFHYYKLDYYRLAHIFETAGKLAAFYDPEFENEDAGIGSLQINGEEI